MVSGGDEVIYAGLGAVTVIVSDADGNNTVTGSFGGSSVTPGSGDNTIALGGYGNYIKLGDGQNAIDAGLGSETVEIAGGTAAIKVQGFYDAFNIDGSATKITCFAGYATINLGAQFTGTNSVDLHGLVGDVLTFAHGVGTIAKLDGEIVATVNSSVGQTLSAIDDGTEGLKIVLGTIVPPAPTVLAETQWGMNTTLADATKIVHLVGYDNPVTCGDGNHTVDGDNSGLALTLDSGDNAVSVNSYHHTLKLGVDAHGAFTGNDNNTVTGTLGSTIIHTGSGSQSIDDAGLHNDITTGAGNQNTVITQEGGSTVTLNGWTNLIPTGAGHTQVSSGYFNTDKITSLGSHGGVEVRDFSTLFGDVLNCTM